MNGSKVRTKKYLILQYNLNCPQMTAKEIAEKVGTTINYVYKVLSETKEPSKNVRGRFGRIFGHGKVWYEYYVPKSWLESLDAPVVNARTGMRQIGFRSAGDLCSIQIHPNGHLIIWPNSSGWRQWLINELTARGWSRECAEVVAEHAQLNVSVLEAGVKPANPMILPKDFYLETEWGLIICRDDSPEKSTLELKISIPNMRKYLGVPEIIKRLETLEQGSITIAQRQRAIESLLYLLVKYLRGIEVNNLSTTQSSTKTQIEQS